MSEKEVNPTTYLSKKEMDELRKSAQENVDKYVIPFVDRVKKQMKINRRPKIKSFLPLSG